MHVHPVTPNTFCHDIKTYLREYCSISNIHGVHYLTSNRTKIEKFVWAILLLISVASCVYMIAKIYEKYENNPIVISFDTKQHTLFEVPFPAVTLCPQSKCVSSKFNYSDIYYKFSSGKSISEKDLQKFSYLNMLCENQDFGSLNLTLDKFVEDDFFDVIEEVRPDLRMFCRYDEEDCNVLWLPIMTQEGICYTFNMQRKLFRESFFNYFEKFYQNFSDSVVEDSEFDVDSGYSGSLISYPLRAYKSGNQIALKLILMQSTSDMDPVCDSYSQGYKVLLHNPYDIPIFSEHHIEVSYNKKLMIAVQPNVVTTSPEVKKFHPDKRKCYLSTERPLMFFRHYTQSNCILECATNVTLKLCGCVVFYMPRNNETKICSTGSKECVVRAEDYAFEGEYVSRFLGKSETLCDCRPSCNEWKYTVETSQRDYDLKKHLSVRNLKLEIGGNYYDSMLTVYFKDDLFMMLQRNELYTIFDFISNFGGLLGLFLGFSLISLMEIVYFFTLRPFFNNRLYGRWMIEK